MRDNEDSYAELELEGEKPSDKQEKQDIETKAVNVEKSDENSDLAGKTVTEQKNGEIIVTEYNDASQKILVTKKDLKGNVKRIINYYEDGSVKMNTEYLKDGSYKIVLYDVDGSRTSYIEKHPDGSSDAIYYNVDKKGGYMMLRLDKEKNVIEQKVFPAE